MKRNDTSKQLYKAIQEQIMPVCNSIQGNRFHNTIIEISNNATDITFKDLIEALMDNNELILNDSIINNIDDDVLNRVFNMLCKDLNC